MSEVDAYGLLMSTLDDLEATALRIKEQRDDLLSALVSLDERLRECMENPISAAEAYDSFYREIVDEAIKKAKA